eukprot:c13492_g1_i2.p2 GENE.c13492_g1_i2~~c13492_g1_i2.p2  ORF type:complete len:231 (+),score=40.73 c13492_g1_i2:418-1110(+)
MAGSRPAPRCALFYKRRADRCAFATQTSIFAVQYGSGADSGTILGADSRTTTGSYIANRVTDKVTKLTDFVYCCRSGSAADTQAVAEGVKYNLALYQQMTGEQPPVRIAARLVGDIVYQNKDALSAGIIVAGYDKELGGQVYTIPLGGGVVPQPFSIGGSGSTYIYGWCDANYKEGMTREECIEFVKNGLALAMARDGSSGGVIRLAIIDATGVQRFMYSGDEIPAHFTK